MEAAHAENARAIAGVIRPLVAGRAIRRQHGCECSPVRMTKREQAAGSPSRNTAERDRVTAIGCRCQARRRICIQRCRRKAEYRLAVDGTVLWVKAQTFFADGDGVT